MSMRWGLSATSRFLPLAVLVVIGMLEAVSLHLASRDILPIDPVATPAIAESVGVKDTAIPLLRRGLIAAAVAAIAIAAVAEK